jgi:D-alanyl-D-alanine carboxypeptidase/D-alanyl-D-alanine-endopeptidase (penicillin-binding protein 4)
MLQLFGAGIISLWLETIGIQPPTWQPQELLTPNLLLLEHQDPSIKATVKQYLERLSQKGFIQAEQGIWIQSGDNLLANYAGDKPLPAASLTKVATSLASLKTWKPGYQFVTQIGATGPIDNGVLQGDLVIQGSGDPLFVWEEAISLGNTLNTMGINRVMGDLVITGNFGMNYETDPGLAGNLLREGLNAQAWSPEAEAQYSTMPKGTPRPHVVIAGIVRPAVAPPLQQRLLISHQSLHLFELLKQMNIYSNNAMAEMLAASLGGASVVAQQAAIAAEVPPTEIQLLNGSGLSPENRISPRAVCGMFQAIQRQLQPYNLTIADLFPVAGRDRGTLETRKIPQAAVVKTGTLWDVSALAGVIPTRDYSSVWFAIINRGEGVEEFRDQQDQLLQALSQHWGAAQTLPPAFRYHPIMERVGETSRNTILLPHAAQPSS